MPACVPCQVRHDEPMPIVLNGTFGGAGIFGRPEVDSVVRSLASRVGKSEVPGPLTRGESTPDVPQDHLDRQVATCLSCIA